MPKTITIAATELPTKKLEDWRYTDVSSLAGEYQVATARSDKKTTSFSEAHLLFLNGLLVQQNLPSRARLEHASTALSKTTQTIFDRLNQGTGQIHVTVDATSTASIKIVYLQTSQDVLSRPTLAITIGKDARVTLDEQIVDAAESGLCNADISVTLQAGARLVHRVQQLAASPVAHVQTRRVTLARDAEYNVALALHGTNLTRHNLLVELTGENANAHINGVYVARANHHVDCHIVVDHQAAATGSAQIVKGVLADKAKGVFNGKIFVRRAAEGSSAHQLNKTVLLDTTAQMNTKPELHINTDKVTCSHGATIGQLSNEALFYLTSRGMSATAAREQLLQAFLLADMPSDSHLAVQKLLV